MQRPQCMLAVMLSALALSGCMFFETRADRNLRKQPAYQTGFSDGCATANAEGANMRRGDTVRDDFLYRSDKAYRVGWSNGHSSCRRLEATDKASNPLSDVNPGGGH
ncbi:MAG TPA: hypothetical protein VG819_14375 [Rhizomicrobium sp.]|nr:hypothetical protein [Rhizomicrobium sp.]